jgi:hypothetical protein
MAQSTPGLLRASFDVFVKDYARDYANTMSGNRLLGDQDRYDEAYASFLKGGRHAREAYAVRGGPLALDAKKPRRSEASLTFRGDAARYAIHAAS